MSVRRGLTALTLLLCVMAGPVAGETVVETWRSPFGTPRSVSVNPTDGSVWAATGETIMHLAADGTILGQTVAGPIKPVSVSVNSSDGSCWVAHNGVLGPPPRPGAAVVHLSASGAVLWQGGGFSAPSSVSVNPSDGSCWVAEYMHGQVVHLSAAGEELWRGGDFTRPQSVSVDPSDGSCWVACQGIPPDDVHPFDGGDDRGCYAQSSVVHLSALGEVLWQGEEFDAPSSVSVDPRDGSCWVADTHNGCLVHLSAGGAELAREDLLTIMPDAVSVDPSDGSCWVASWIVPGGGDHSEVRHFSAAGEELWQSEAFPVALSVVSLAISANPSDGSCWATAPGTAQVIHLAATGEVVWQGGGSFAFGAPVSANAQDGSCWAADSLHGQVVHLSVAGEELWRGGEFSFPYRVSVDPSDGSCWVVDSDPNSYPMDSVTHLSAAGEELWQRDFTVSGGLGPIAANSADGSCWVIAGTEVVHLSASGVELGRAGGFTWPRSVSVNPSDGSCWVTCGGTSTGSGYVNSAVVHLSASGAVLWEGDEFSNPSCVSVNPTDGSCWVADAGNHQVVHLSAAGDELWREGEPFIPPYPYAVSVSADDGSCWAAGGAELVHLAADGTELWRGESCCPRSISADPSDGSCWVEERGSGQVVHLGTPGFHFFASPWAGPAPLTVAFTDVSVSVGGSAWAWDFGDGGSSAEQNPSHEYAKVGTYPVSFTVEGASGSETETKEHYIHVTFADVPFQPVPQWARHQILDCVDAGVVQGFPDGTYRPDMVVTRDQMAVYIARALALPTGDAAVQTPSGPAQPTFPDVGEEHWAYRHIEYCSAAGVVQGFPDGNYHPDEPVNRGQMAVYIARSQVTPSGDAALPDPPAEPTFPDVTAGNDWAWCYPHVEYCASEAIVQGYADGYHPERIVTRDQMAVYVARAFGLE